MAAVYLDFPQPRLTIARMQEADRCSRSLNLLLIAGAFASTGFGVLSMMRKPDPPLREIPDRTTPLDVNRATYEQLLRVTGMTPRLARAILQRRTERGPFQDLQDLLEVPGIGPKTLEKLQPFLRADGLKSIESK